MRFGIACFVILFLGTELYHWLMGLGQFELSLSMTIVAGGALAVASNLPQSANTPAKVKSPEPESSMTVSQPSSQPKQLSLDQQDTISFKIRPPL